MKKRWSVLGIALSATLLISSFAFAEEANSVKDIPVGSSSEVEMVGTIEPTILSVTMPSFVPFNISNSVSSQNKVVSPRINVKNNSNVPIQVDVSTTRIDLSKMKNTTWSNNGVVGDYQIAIGLKEEEVKNEMPKNLEHTRWLSSGVNEDKNVLILNANQEGAMYVVGTLGARVSESATFNVTPTFVVRKTSGL